MIILVAALLFAALLFWFGLIRSHWIAPAALFAASGPAIAAFSWNYDAMRITVHLLMNLSLFYAAFAFGRWAADRTVRTAAEAKYHSSRRSEHHVERHGTRPGRRL